MTLYLQLDMVFLVRLSEMVNGAPSKLNKLLILISYLISYLS